jgi:hypothetical protein
MQVELEHRLSGERVPDALSRRQAAGTDWTNVRRRPLKGPSSNVGRAGGGSAFEPLVSPVDSQPFAVLASFTFARRERRQASVTQGDAVALAVGVRFGAYLLLGERRPATRCHGPARMPGERIYVNLYGNFPNISYRPFQIPKKAAPFGLG